MLSAMGEETDRIVGLELGADDYLPKPCNPRELLARVRAVLRRRREPRRRGRRWAPACEFAGWRLDLVRRELRSPRGRGGQPVQRRVLAAARLRRAAAAGADPRPAAGLARGPDTEAYDRAIDVQISRLRKKLDDGAGRPGADPHHPQRGLHLHRQGPRDGVSHGARRRRRATLVRRRLLGAGRAQPASARSPSTPGRPQPAAADAGLLPRRRDRPGAASGGPGADRQRPPAADLPPRDRPPSRRPGAAGPHVPPARETLAQLLGVDPTTLVVAPTARRSPTAAPFRWCAASWPGTASRREERFLFAPFQVGAASRTGAG